MYVIDQFLLDGSPTHVHHTDVTTMQPQKRELSAIMGEVVRAQLPDARDSSANAHWFRISVLNLNYELLHRVFEYRNDPEAWPEASDLMRH